MSTAPLAVTPGEPAGIGPDLAAMLSQKPQAIPVVYLVDPDVLQERARQLGLPLDINLYKPGNTPVNNAGIANVLPIKTATPVTAGNGNPRNSRYVIETLRRSVEGCLGGEFSALVTGPVNKALISESGLAFSGHTEYLAEQTGGHPVMMLAAGDLRVALATTHLPLKQVSETITPGLLESVLLTLNRDLRKKFGIAQPRILVCGLNPHAGESGYLGNEEIDTIEPTLAELRERGLRLLGPLPADTLFTPKYLGGADAVLAMYHDQGLPVLKYAGFGSAVNITLGLPIIRTSVDHGTAFDLAGTGNADCGSLQAALDTAVALARQHG